MIHLPWRYPFTKDLSNISFDSYSISNIFCSSIYIVYSKRQEAWKKITNKANDTDNKNNTVPGLNKHFRTHEKAYRKDKWIVTNIW